MPYRFADRMTRMQSSAVREILKVTERPDIISFAGGLPAPETFPLEVVATAHAEVFAEDGAGAMQYATTEGWRPLREWIARRMQARGVSAFPRLDGHVEIAGRVGHLAEHRQIGGGQQAVRVRLHEQVESLLPAAPGDRGTCALDKAKAGAVAHRGPHLYPWPT